MATGKPNRAVAPSTSAEDADQDDPVTWSELRWSALQLPEPEAFALMASVFRTHQIMVAAIEAELKPFNLGLSRYLMLTALLLTPSRARSMSRLSRHIMVHPTTVTVVVDQLQQEGLVERVPHATDRRVTLVRITPAGEALARRAGVALAAMRFAFPDLGHTKNRQLIALLTELRALVGDTAVGRNGGAQ